MEPTAPNDPTAGITFLLSEIRRLDQELKALNKRPLPATEEQVKELIKIEKSRPVLVATEKVVEQLLGKTGAHVTGFQDVYKDFIGQLNSQTRMLRQELTTQAAAMQAAAAAGQGAAQAVQASAAVVAATGKELHRPIRVEGGVFGFTDWRTLGGTVVASALVGALLLSVFSSKVSKEDYEQLQAKEQKWEKNYASVLKEDAYYFDQIKRYKAKNPKTTDFPAYKGAK